MDESPLPPPAADTPETITRPETARARAEAHDAGGRIKSDEKVASGKPAFERKFGADFHVLSGTWRWVTYVVDRKKGRWWKRVAGPDGAVVYERDEPLPDHRGRGSARRTKP